MDDYSTSVSRCAFDIHRCIHVPMLCREGILFAMSRKPGELGGRVDHNKPPPHLNFLFILSEFSYRLLAVDRCGERGVIPFLMKQLPEGQLKRIKEGKFPGWDAFLAYYRNTQVTKGGVATPLVSKKGRKRSLQKGNIGCFSLCAVKYGKLLLMHARAIYISASVANILQCYLAGVIMWGFLLSVTLQLVKVFALPKS